MTAAPAQPTCRGPHSGQPHPLPGPGAPPASSAAGDGGCSRREIQRSRRRGSYLRWALSSRPGCPGPPAACRRRGPSRAASSAAGLFTRLCRRTPTGSSRDARVTCSPGLGEGVAQRRRRAGAGGGGSLGALELRSHVSGAGTRPRRPAQPWRRRGRHPPPGLRPSVTPGPERICY